MQIHNKRHMEGTWRQQASLVGKQQKSSESSSEKGFILGDSKDILQEVELF